MSDLYDLLGVSKTASPEDIKKAFRKLAIQCHPDKCSGMDDKTKSESEAHFKEINEAYSVLSDPHKRDMYDKFGTVDGSAGGHGHHNVFNMDDLLRDMFGHGGHPMHHMNAGGFSFVFNMGGGGPGPGPRPEPRPGCDVIDVPVDICDIFYGQTKKVEFEMPESCNACGGTGAQDPSHILNCMTCKGLGNIQHHLSPFHVQNVLCPSCGGQGSTVQHNKQCLKCKGQKLLFTKKVFELKLPKGIPNMYEVLMKGRGSYNLTARCNNDVKFRFVYKIQEPYTIDDNKNVHYSIKITIEELLGGFQKDIMIYKENYTFTSAAYFNPNDKIITLPGMGLYDMTCEIQRDCFIHFEVDFRQCDRLVKYVDVLRKLLKTPPLSEQETPHKKITI